MTSEDESSSSVSIILKGRQKCPYVPNHGLCVRVVRSSELYPGFRCTGATWDAGPGHYGKPMCLDRHVTYLPSGDYLIAETELGPVQGKLTRQLGADFAKVCVNRDGSI